MGVIAQGRRGQHVLDDTWWRDAAIYQLYLRSFADGDGDGVGDLRGARARLPYLRELGVDALWISPWYASPMADGGYDVADYRAIEPVFGTIDDAATFIAEADRLGLRTIVDVVPNHVSDRHRWFQEALAAGPGSPARERFWFRPGRGRHGERPPNGWATQFGGERAWARVEGPDGPEEWYLHLFSAAQPDLNWDHEDVRREHEDVLRFWFDLGAAGVRIDSAALVCKDPTLPELDTAPAPGRHPFLDRDELHDVYRAWRRVADEYDPPRVLIGEVWLEDRDRFARYLRADELHTAFNFDFLTRPWDAASLRASIDATLAVHAPVGAPSTWVLSNHDVTRVVTRYGREDSTFSFDAKRRGRPPSDLDLGRRRARAAALLAMALPGSFYVYQGEELGLPEVEGIPPELIQDPMHVQSGGMDPGRDGCRVPLPWSGTEPPYGFSPPGAPARPWLPQPGDWAALTAAAQATEPDSTLTLYRRALELRRRHLRGLGAELTWLAAPADVLAFRRGPLVCVVNLGRRPASCPPGGLLVASGPAADGLVPPDTAVWVLAGDSAADPLRRAERAPGATTTDPPPPTSTHHKGDQ